MVVSIIRVQSSKCLKCEQAYILPQRILHCLCCVLCVLADTFHSLHVFGDAINVVRVRHAIDETLWTVGVPLF